MAGIFKAYDVRGTYPDQIDESTARKIGQAFHHLVAEDPGPIVVSRDMRSHSVPLCEALIDGLRTAGLDVIDIGLATTPMNYFAVGHLEAAGGIQVTASHNPARYNGLKFSLREAQPVSGDHGIPLLEEKVAAGDLRTAAERGKLEQAEIFDDYRRHVLFFLERPDEARPVKVVFDAANGMGAIYQPLLEQLGIEVVTLYFELDGTFPNHEANPLKMENLADLCKAVKKEKADLGVSFDGDADRAAFVDERGRPVGSDLMTALIGGKLLERAPGSHIIYDLRSSRAVAEYITELGGQPVRERVGHSFIKATLRETDGIFGGELAGHYYFKDNYYADCAVLAVIEVLNLLWSGEESLSEHVEPLLRYSKSLEINFEVEDKAAKIEELGEKYSDGQIDYLDGITVAYEDWWFNVRPSNTEPYLRLVLEAGSDSDLDNRRDELQSILGTPAE